MNLRNFPDVSSRGRARKYTEKMKELLLESALKAYTSALGEVLDKTKSLRDNIEECRHGNEVQELFDDWSANVEAMHLADLEVVRLVSGADQAYHQGRHDEQVEMIANLDNLRPPRGCEGDGV